LNDLQRNRLSYCHRIGLLAPSPVSKLSLFLSLSGGGMWWARSQIIRSLRNKSFNTFLVEISLIFLNDLSLILWHSAPPPQKKRREKKGLSTQTFMPGIADNSTNETFKDDWIFGRKCRHQFSVQIVFKYQDNTTLGRCHEPSRHLVRSSVLIFVYSSHIQIQLSVRASFIRIYRKQERSR
jgi:hypothetical protein